MSLTKSRALSNSPSLQAALTRISKVVVDGLISLSGILPYIFKASSIRPASVSPSNIRLKKAILNFGPCSHPSATTKELIKKLRDDGWTNLLRDVVLFCKKHGISVPDMDGFYVDFIRSRKEDETSAKHHYKYDVFMVAVDQQLQELNIRFSVQSTELLILCTSLDPRNSFRSFNLENICLLAAKFYPSDFSEQERDNLRCQLRHCELDVLRNQEFLNLSTIPELCQKLFETEKLTDYHLIDRLIRLVLTLPVSTATTERAFSAMKLVKSSDMGMLNGYIVFVPLLCIYRINIWSKILDPKDTSPWTRRF